MRFPLLLSALIVSQVSFSQAKPDSSFGIIHVVHRSKPEKPDSCGKCYDPELEVPDIDAAGVSHGYILTPLGRLLFTPLAYMTDYGVGYNVVLYLKGKEISSKAAQYTELQKNIVLEFQRDGTLKYWLKTDYIESPFDTVHRPDGQTVVSHNIAPSSKLHLKKIYTSGTWKANFDTHTLSIDFGQNDLSLLPLEGIYTSLGAGTLDLQQTMDVDSLVKGKMLKYKKVINTYFQYY
jgi:hypothetical protein